MRVLDVGTGSGILAIAAAKRGAAQVVALDIDAMALEVAAENAARNDVGERISLHRASLPLEPQDGHEPTGHEVFGAKGEWDAAFDLVLMNILAGVIARAAKAIAALLRATGTFVVSGIVQTQEDGVQEALAAAKLCVKERLTQTDWVALIGRKERG
jgi:ribosomal protein L11 methyltransferase